MAVRTFRVISSALTTTMSTKFTASTDRTVIVKHWAIYNPNGAARTVTIQGGPSATPRVWFVELVPSGECVRFDTWFVLKESDIIQAKQDVGSDVSLYVSGTNLDGDPS